MKYKVGDKVRVVNFTDNHFLFPNPVGLVGTISKIHHPGQHPYPYRVDFPIPPEDADTYPDLFGESELEGAA